MIRFPPATVLDAAAIDRLRKGSPTRAQMRAVKSQVVSRPPG